jgi:hypothetical protein
MTAKEKAIELVSKMCLLDCRDENIIIAKQCALICVDEILEFHDRIDVKYWKEVKQEINNL